MTSLLDDWAAEIHREFPEHKDPKSGLSQDCPRCRELAERLVNMQVHRLLTIGILEDEPIAVNEVPFGHA